MLEVHIWGAVVVKDAFAGISYTSVFNAIIQKDLILAIPWMSHRNEFLLCSR